MYRSNKFGSGLAIGVAIGLMLGGAGVATAAFGKKGWERFGPMFQQGYVAGFNDCVRIAKGLTPNGYVARNFTLVPKAKPTVWAKMISDLYAEEKHHNRAMSQIMVIAGQKIAARYNYEAPAPRDAGMDGLRKLMEYRRRELLKATPQTAKSDAAEGAASDAGAEDGGEADDEKVAKAAAPGEGADEEPAIKPDGETAPESESDEAHD